MRPKLAAIVIAIGTACAPAADRPRVDTIVVYSAASLATPMRTALDTFSARTGAIVQVEHGGSLELARRVTELGRIPDVIALADEEVFPDVLMPSSTSWYATFARNRMVVAYTHRSRHAALARNGDWRAVLLRDDVLVGRPDPAIAPAGYRALMVFALAESYYRDPGLAVRLAARTPSARLRGNAAELAALLSAGELDYIIEYESLARVMGFRMIPLPSEIDLSDPAHAATYARAEVRVANGRDSVTRRGAPIHYGISVLRRAPHQGVGERFVELLLGPVGRSILRSSHVDALDVPRFAGDSIPVALSGSIK